MTRYLSGLCVAGLGLCGGCWLAVAAVASGGEPAGHAGRRRAGGGRIRRLFGVAAGRVVELYADARPAASLAAAADRENSGS